MNTILSKHKNNKGAGLLEVLIALFVVVVGLAAIAHFQGNLLSGSADNKARGQAQVLAERKNEEFKNLMLKGEFTAIAGSASAETITGVNETFSRSWIIDDKGDSKFIEIRVTWGGATDAETLVLTNVLVYASPAASASISEFGGETFGLAPNPNQNASESRSEIVDLFDGSGSLLAGVSSLGNGLYSLGGETYRDDDNGTTGTLVIACTGLVGFDLNLSYPDNYPGSYNALTGIFTTPSSAPGYLYTKRFIDDGVEVIDLYTQHYTVSGTTYTLFDWCAAEHRYFGGVIIPIKGRVHTEYTLDDIKIDHNKEDMYCGFYADVGATEQPYACYVGGNCDESSGVASPSATQCSVSSTVRKDNVGPGGFSGNVGIIDVDDDGGGKESVCFEGDLEGTSTNFFTARKYKAVQSSIGVTKEEGINESYACQDFYIVGRQAKLSKLAAKCTVEVGTINLPPQEVVRTISGDNAVVTTQNVARCTPRTNVSYMFTVTVTGGTATTVETGSGTVCAGTGVSGEYLCTESLSGTSITIYASNSTQSGSCLISALSASDTTRSCDGSTAPDNSGSIVLSSPSTYTLSGTIAGISGTGGYKVTVTADSFTGTPSCTFTTTTFNCTISTLESSVRMEIKKGKASDSCNKNGLDGSTTTFTGVCELSP